MKKYQDAAFRILCNLLDDNIRNVRPLALADMIKMFPEADVNVLKAAVDTQYQRILNAYYPD